MPALQPLRKLFLRLWRHISPRRRGQFGLLLALMVVSSFAEILSIGSVLPFLAVLAAPSQVYEHPMAQPFIDRLGLSSADQLLFPLALAFGLASLVAGAMRLLLLWCSTRLSFATGSDLSVSIYRRTLYQPYAVHLARNSSEIINGISSKTNAVIYSVMTPCLVLVSSGIMLIAILAVLISVDPIISSLAFGGFGLIYVAIARLTRAQKIRNGENIARESTRVIKSLQEGLGGIRDVLIDGSQATYCQIYRSADSSLRVAQGNNQFVAQSPRYGMEALGMLMISALAYMLSLQSDGIAKAIPVLGALAMGAQRLLPVMQQAYQSWSSMQGSQASFQDALDLLDQSLPEYADEPPPEPLPFRRCIRLNQIGFRYGPEFPWVLKDVNLLVEKGSRIGFIGTTGSGKSTLLDVVMGLLQPTEGSLEVDGQGVLASNRRAWQMHIAHVPQAIFLSDASIEENIAFGVSPDQIDHERVNRAARQAQIADLIESWPQKYQTLVGERGIRLSGGQRQRIGIARALYKQADVIVFDEATSALDSETERAVMDAIAGLSQSLTVLIVAHRLSTLKDCSPIVELGAGGVLRLGSYREIVATTD
jgi:ATP-binding cassette subfamily B protein